MKINEKSWLLLACFAFGLCAGIGYLLATWPPANPNPSAVHHVAADLNSAGFPRSNDTASQIGTNLESPSEAPFSADALRSLVGEGDALMIGGHYAKAADRYEAARGVVGQATAAIDLRLAISAEYDERLSNAVEIYQRCLEATLPDLQRWIALSGLSRVWIERGNRMESLAVLSELSQELMSHPSAPEELRAQVQYQLGNVLQDLALLEYHYDLTKPDGVAFHTVIPQIESIIELVRLADDPNATSGEPNSSQSDNRDPPIVGANSLSGQIALLQRPDDQIELMTVRAEAPLQPVGQILKQLASVAELELRASQQAMSVISGRSQKLSAESAQLSNLLDCLLIPYHLCWHQTENGIEIFTIEEDTSCGGGYWSAAMDRTFRRFAVSFPGDYRASAALLSRANAYLIRGDLNNAGARYQELAQQRLGGELLAKLFFNVGKFELAAGRQDAAIRSFYLAIDQSHRTGFQSTAYWMVGQLSLDRGLLDQAVKAAGRSLVYARTDQQRRLAALTMARGYLFSGQPLRANQVLFENQRVFAGSDAQPIAALLGSYSRFIGMSDRKNLESESYRLFSAVATLDREQFRDPLDAYLCSLAWADLGFRDRAQVALRQAIELARADAWKRQFQFELGEHLAETDQLEEAVAVFAQVILDPNDDWYNKSLMQIAELQLRLNRFDECLEVCNRLMHRQLIEDDKQFVLNVMGRGYRARGEHHSAALCFAGMIPIESNVPSR